MNRNLSKFKEIWVDILIFIVSFIVFIPLLFYGNPTRVGDGSEYYALSLAWISTNKPFMTETSWQVYDRVYNSGEINYLVDTTSLKKWFPGLKLGNTFDMLHFWFYSFCAAIITKMGNIIGIRIPIHMNFILLHYIMLTSMFFIAWRNLRWKGLITAIILTFLSPVIWYFDKVHTELFTYCVTSISVIYFLRKKYFYSAFFLALAATQNISFTAISILVLGFGVILREKKVFSLTEAILIVLTIGTLAIHPAYYFSRWGYIDPILVSNKANIGQNLKYFYIWFIDPDVGLLPNWPFGFCLLASLFFPGREKKLNDSSIFPWLVFLTVYICVNLWANSSTANLNHGATPNIARYSIWYLSLFIPALLIFIEKISSKSWMKIFIFFSIACGIIYNTYFFIPNKPETYTKPTFFSFWLQKNFSKLYNPPPEIFAERYGGVGEMPALMDTFAIIGPDCHKILILNNPLDVGYDIIRDNNCNFELKKLSSIIEKKFLSNKIIMIPSYIWLTDAEIKENGLSLR